jgi:hypothetical protein
MLDANLKTLGRKFDTGKAEYGLVPPHALHETVKVLTVGAQKYARDNWKHVPDRKRRYFDAMERHIWAWKRGEVNDPEDNLHHLAHAICCAMFLYEVDLYYNEGESNGKTKEQNENVAQDGRKRKSPFRREASRSEVQKFVYAVTPSTTFVCPWTTYARTDIRCI